MCGMIGGMIGFFFLIKFDDAKSCYNYMKQYVGNQKQIKLLESEITFFE